jgi:hypothetical protein
MNNIYFFHNFNNLLKSQSQTHKSINDLIDDKLNNNGTDIDITDKENNIINKYKDLNVICSIIFDKFALISKEIDNYLSENCKHDWIFDSVDIDPDHSTMIKYCSNCNTTKF